MVSYYHSNFVLISSEKILRMMVSDYFILLIEWLYIWNRIVACLASVKSLLNDYFWINIHFFSSISSLAKY